MSTPDEFRALPDPDDLLAFDDVPADDELEVLDDAEAQVIDVESPVTQEDLSTNDLIYNGALPEDLEQDNVGFREMEADEQEPGRRDTIDERVRQEEPEEGSDVVPQQRREG